MLKFDIVTRSPRYQLHELPAPGLTNAITFCTGDQDTRSPWRSWTSIVLVVPNRQLSAGILVELKTPGFKIPDTCGGRVTTLVGVALLTGFILTLQAQSIRIKEIIIIIRCNAAMNEVFNLIY